MVLRARYNIIIIVVIITITTITMIVVVVVMVVVVVVVVVVVAVVVVVVIVAAVVAAVVVVVVVVVVVGETIPLQAWTGPQGSRRLRLPDFQSAHEGGKFVSPMHRPPLPLGNNPGTLFC